MTTTIEGPAWQENMGQGNRRKLENRLEMVLGKNRVLRVLTPELKPMGHSQSLLTPQYEP